MRGGARYLGVELGPGSWQRQWQGVATKILRRTAEILNAGEALGTRIVHYRVYCASLALYREKFSALDGFLFDAHRQAAQRLSASPLGGFLLGALAGLAVAGLLHGGGGDARLPKRLGFARRLRRLSPGGASQRSRPSPAPTTPCSTIPSGFGSATRFRSPPKRFGLARLGTPGWQKRFFAPGRRPSSRISSSCGCVPLLVRAPRLGVAHRDGSRMPQCPWSSRHRLHLSVGPTSQRQSS